LTEDGEIGEVGVVALVVPVLLLVGKPGPDTAITHLLKEVDALVMEARMVQVTARGDVVCILH